MAVAAGAMATRRRSDPGRRLVLALPLALAPAAALSRGPGVEWGVVHGSVHAPMPEGLAISPRALDDRPENLRILRRLGDAGCAGSDRKSTRLNSSHMVQSRMPSSA